MHAKEEFCSDQLQELITTLQCEVIKKKSEVKESVKKYEHNSLQKNGQLPKQAQDDQYRALLKEFNYTKWLLSVWNISL